MLNEANMNPLEVSSKRAPFSQTVFDNISSEIYSLCILESSGLILSQFAAELTMP